MTLSEIRAELEDEQTWRRDEIRFLRNQLTNMKGWREKKLFRRALVVMLYAHYEGFCKFALERYARSVNRAAISCSAATPAVVAGAWARIFTAIESGDQKSKVFKKALPNDEKLHRLARRREFVERISEFQNSIAKITDDAVDTESNLWPIVLKKNLFQLGLDHDSFSTHDGAIRQLMNRRNGIAHGAERDGLRELDYSRLERAVFRIMDDLMELVMKAIRDEAYKA